MRYEHYENRRRKKLKLVFDEMSRHRRAYPGLKQQNTIGYQQTAQTTKAADYEKLAEIQDALRTGTLTDNLR